MKSKHEQHVFKYGYLLKQFNPHLTNETFIYTLIVILLQTGFLIGKNYTFTNGEYRIFYKQNSYEFTNVMLTSQNTCNLRKSVRYGSTSQDGVFWRKTYFCYFMMLFNV